MSDTGNIPAAMIEAGARAEYERDVSCPHANALPWEVAHHSVVEAYRERFAAGLAAAFAECEVREEARNVSPYVTRWWRYGIDGGWPGHERRLVITTPPVVVTPAQEG